MDPVLSTEIRALFTSRETSYLRNLVPLLPKNEQSPFKEWTKMWNDVNCQFEQKVNAMKAVQNGLLVDDSASTNSQATDMEPRRRRRKTDFFQNDLLLDTPEIVTRSALQELNINSAIKMRSLSPNLARYKRLSFSFSEVEENTMDLLMECHSSPGSRRSSRIYPLSLDISDRKDSVSAILETDFVQAFTEPSKDAISTKGQAPPENEIPTPTLKTPQDDLVDCDEKSESKTESEYASKIDIPSVDPISVKTKKRITFTTSDLAALEKRTLGEVTDVKEKKERSELVIPKRVIRKKKENSSHAEPPKTDLVSGSANASEVVTMRRTTRKGTCFKLDLLEEETNIEVRKEISRSVLPKRVTRKQIRDNFDNLEPPKVDLVSDSTNALEVASNTRQKTRRGTCSKSGQSEKQILPIITSESDGRSKRTELEVGSEKLEPSITKPSKDNAASLKNTQLKKRLPRRVSITASKVRKTTTRKRSSLSNVTTASTRVLTEHGLQTESEQGNRNNILKSEAVLMTEIPSELKKGTDIKEKKKITKSVLPKRVTRKQKENSRDVQPPKIDLVSDCTNTSEVAIAGQTTRRETCLKSEQLNVEQILTTIVSESDGRSKGRKPKIVPEVVKETTSLKKTECKEPRRRRVSITASKVGKTTTRKRPSLSNTTSLSRVQREREGQTLSKREDQNNVLKAEALPLTRVLRERKTDLKKSQKK